MLLDSEFNQVDLKVAYIKSELPLMVASLCGEIDHKISVFVLLTKVNMKRVHIKQYFYSSTSFG